MPPKNLYFDKMMIKVGMRLLVYKGLREGLLEVSGSVVCHVP